MGQQIGGKKQKVEGSALGECNLDPSIAYGPVGQLDRAWARPSPLH